MLPILSKDGWLKNDKKSSINRTITKKIMKNGARKSLLALSLLPKEEQQEVIRWLTEDEKRILVNEASFLGDERMLSIFVDIEGERL